MINIYPSDSPLLDYINFTQYRDIEKVGLHKDDGKIVYDAVLYLIANMDLSSHENYLIWVRNWKTVNAILSRYNHVLKRPKNKGGAYGRIYDATFRNIAAEKGCKWVVTGIGLNKAEISANPNMHELVKEIEGLVHDRRELFLAYTTEALTALYNARTVGKLATGRIVDMNRRVGFDIESSIFGMFGRIFGKAA